MTETQNLQAMGAQRMTSLEIAEITGKQHKNLMRDIRNMEAAWEKAYIALLLSQQNGMSLHRHEVQRRGTCQVGDPMAATGKGAADASRHPTSAGDRSGRDARSGAHRGPRAHLRKQTCRRMHHHDRYRQSAGNGDKESELVPEGSWRSEMETGSVQTDRELRGARSGSGQALRLLREGRENEKEHLSRLDYKGCRDDRRNGQTKKGHNNKLKTE